MYHLSWMKLPVCVQYGQKEQRQKKDAWNSGNSWNYLCETRQSGKARKFRSVCFANERGNINCAIAFLRKNSRNKTIPVDVEVNTREIKQTCEEVLLNDMREDVNEIKFRVTDAEIVQAGTSELNTEEVRQIWTAQNMEKSNVDLRIVILNYIKKIYVFTKKCKPE